jgi:hypothetical protein
MRMRSGEEAGIPHLEPDVHRAGITTHFQQSKQVSSCGLNWDARNVSFLRFSQVYLCPAKFDSEAVESRYRQPASPLSPAATLLSTI